MESELFEKALPERHLVNPRLFVGTAGWSYRDWAGSFYPTGTSSAARLSYYARRFRAVEIDSTFYAIPARTTVRSWYRRTPDDFVFAAKFPRTITHEARLTGCGAEAATFIDVMSELGAKMGPLLLQLPPSLTAERFDDLARFLEYLPDGHIYAVEVRHRSWLTEEFAALLKRWKTAMVLTCGAHLGRFWRVTSRIAYIRWLGPHGVLERFDREQVDRRDAIKWWAPRIAHFLDRGGVVFGFANNNYAGHAPATVPVIKESVASALKRGAPYG